LLWPTKAEVGLEDALAVFERYEGLGDRENIIDRDAHIRDYLGLYH
jgi:hypothetical protein